MHEVYFVSIPECDEYTGFGIKEFASLKDAEFAYRAWCNKAREDWRELFEEDERAAKATVHCIQLHRAEFEDEESWDNGAEPLTFELLDEFKFGLNEFEEWNSFEVSPRWERESPDRNSPEYECECLFSGRVLGRTVNIPVSLCICDDARESFGVAFLGLSDGRKFADWSDGHSIWHAYRHGFRDVGWKFNDEIWGYLDSLPIDGFAKHLVRAKLIEAYGYMHP